MTREKTKEARKVMQHFEDGGKVQARWRTPANSEWKDTELPYWNWDLFEYRINPQPRKVTEEEMEYIKAHAWIKFKSDGRIVYDIFKFAAPEMKKRFVNNFYVLNPDTMEWEDWSEK